MHINVLPFSRRQILLLTRSRRRTISERGCRQKETADTGTDLEERGCSVASAILSVNLPTHDETFIHVFCSLGDDSVDPFCYNPFLYATLVMDAQDEETYAQIDRKQERLTQMRRAFRSAIWTTDIDSFVSNGVQAVIVRQALLLCLTSRCRFPDTRP